MRPYADVPERRIVQILVDLLAILAIVACIKAGVAVYDRISSFAVWGEKIELAGAGLSGNLSQIGDTLGSVPFIGDAIRVPFDAASASASSVRQVGVDMQKQVHDAARTIGLTVALIPIAFILLVWLVPRLRYARKAAKVRSLARSGAGLDLLALRALVTAPLPRLIEVSPDVAAGWRSGDPEVISALAALTLHSVGLNVPGPRMKQIF